MIFPQLVSEHLDKLVSALRTCAGYLTGKPTTIYTTLYNYMQRIRNNQEEFVDVSIQSALSPDHRGMSWLSNERMWYIQGLKMHQFQSNPSGGSMVSADAGFTASGFEHTNSIQHTDTKCIDECKIKRSHTIYYIHVREYIKTYVTLRNITIYYRTLHYIKLRCITLHYVTLHYITLHCIALHNITLHYVTLHNITWLDLHQITLHHITLRSYKHMIEKSW